MRPETITSGTLARWPGGSEEPGSVGAPDWCPLDTTCSFGEPVRAPCTTVSGPFSGSRGLGVARWGTPAVVAATAPAGDPSRCGGVASVGGEMGMADGRGPPLGGPDAVIASTGAGCPPSTLTPPPHHSQGVPWYRMHQRWQIRARQTRVTGLQAGRYTQRCRLLCCCRAYVAAVTTQQLLLPDGLATAHLLTLYFSTGT